MPTNPSLLIVPYRFKAAKLYSQLPESGAGDFTVTRSTTATRTNASGLLESVASGVPRLDYEGGGCPALLVEPAATNLLLRSEEFDNASWVKSSGGTGSVPVVTANNAVAPNGTMTADLISFNRGSGNTISDRSFIRQTPTVVSGTVYFGSLWLKAATPLDVGKQIGLRGVAGGTYLVITLTNDWVRYGSGETAISTTGSYELETRGTFTIDNAVSVLVWGAQLETGSVATSYIPTVAATQTRNADVISVSSVSGLIGQTQGTIYAEVDIRNIIGGRFLSLNTGSAANRILLARNSNNTITFIVTVSSVNQVVITSSILSVGIYKVAAAYQSGSFALYINGSLIGTGSSGTIPACTNIDLGNEVGTNFWNDRIRAAAIYTSRLSNAELAQLTTP